MKGLKEFLEDSIKNEELLKEIERVKDDTAKIVEIAKKHGYEFTEEEFENEKMAAVTGGRKLTKIEGFSSFWKHIGDWFKS